MARVLNLGIVAHVDAGKTTLSERLLFEAGVIGEPGRVDHGTTLTDSLPLEQQRGITIRSAVASLTIGGTAVNLIDTPGHPDFIAEVDRVLGVLDGAVVVISAVEGVQPQTRVLMRALARLRVPTLLFVNKVDRRGADVARVMGEVRRRLRVTPVAMTLVTAQGTRGAVAQGLRLSDEGVRDAWLEALTVADEALLAAYVGDERAIGDRRIADVLAAQTALGQVVPVFAGSAITGVGVRELMRGLGELLPAATADACGPVSGTVFKIERGAAGEKVAFVRMFSGKLGVRERLGEDKVTAISVFERGAWIRRGDVSAGQIGKLWGLAHRKVGDPIGRPRAAAVPRFFPPPAMEAVVVPVREGDHVTLRAALNRLAEQDPLINVRADARDVAVSLYGEVQKEVIQATLAQEFGIAVTFRETTPLYIERPAGVGEAAEILHDEANPFRATIGLRVEPALPGTGISFRLEVDFRTVPLSVFGNLDAFASSMRQYVCQTLGEGLHGWPVTDCLVTMTRSNYSSADGPPSTRGPLSTAADFRKLTPLVLMRALELAGTAVCEPMSKVRLDAPMETIGVLMPALSRLGPVSITQTVRGDDVVIEAVLPAARVQLLHRDLPGLTSGEGVLEAEFGGYQPLAGGPVGRRRSTANPLNRKEYLASL